MTDQPRIRISWMKAFWLLFKGSPDVVGKGYKWKSSLLMGALMTTISAPFFLENIHARFLGALPPEAPLIQTTGYFVHKFAEVGLRKVPYIEFETDDGRRYVTSKRVMTNDIEALGRIRPPVHVYAEGFLLENGKGSYWPVAIRTLYGIDVIPPQQLHDSLDRARNPWRQCVVMSLFAGLLWAFSIVNVWRLKKKLSQEN